MSTVKRCEACAVNGGYGFLVVNIESTRALRIEKCDACDQFQDDLEAVRFVEAAAQGKRPRYTERQTRHAKRALKQLWGRK